MQGRNEGRYWHFGGRLSGWPTSFTKAPVRSPSIQASAVWRFSLIVYLAGKRICCIWLVRGSDCLCMLDTLGVALLYNVRWIQHQLFLPHDWIPQRYFKWTHRCCDTRHVPLGSRISWSIWCCLQLAIDIVRRYPRVQRLDKGFI
jgi:hypothetical protein